MTDRESLEQKKMKLVGIYNALIESIDAYGLQDLAYSNGPLKEMLRKREMVKGEIDLINKQIENGGF